MRFTRLTQWKSGVYIKISVHYWYLKFVQHFKAQLSPLTQRTYPSLALSWGVLRNLQCQGGRCNSMRRGKSIGLHYIPCFIIFVDCPFVFLGGFWRFLPSPAGRSICQRAEMLLVVAELLPWVSSFSPHSRWYCLLRLLHSYSKKFQMTTCSCLCCWTVPLLSLLSTCTCPGGMFSLFQG